MASENDKALFKKLYIDNHNIMLKYARNFFNNREIAEDVVQNTFLVALENVDNVINSANPGGWLMNTLRNIIGDVYRSQKRLLDIYVQFDENRIATDFTSDPRIEYKGIVGEEDLDLLFQVYCNGMTYQEAADNLGISISACKKRIQRAKKKFKHALE